MKAGISAISANLNNSVSNSYSPTQKPLAEALAKPLSESDLHRMKPTARGFDFLSDLQSLFLPD